MPMSSQTFAIFHWLMISEIMDNEPTQNRSLQFACCIRASPGLGKLIACHSRPRSDPSYLDDKRIDKAVGNSSSTDPYAILPLRPPLPSPRQRVSPVVINHSTAMRWTKMTTSKKMALRQRCSTAVGRTRLSDVFL